MAAQWIAREPNHHAAVALGTGSAGRLAAQGTPDQ
jgi:hypothetical protein